MTLCALPVLYALCMPLLQHVDVIGGSVPLVHLTRSPNNPARGQPSISNFIAAPSASGIMANLAAPAICLMWLQPLAPSSPFWSRALERASLALFTTFWFLFLATPFTESPTAHGVFVGLMGLAVTVRDTVKLTHGEADGEAGWVPRLLVAVGFGTASLIVITGAVANCPCGFTFPAEVLTFGCFFLFPAVRI